MCLRADPPDVAFCAWLHAHLLHQMLLRGAVSLIRPHVEGKCWAAAELGLNSNQTLFTMLKFDLRRRKNDSSEMENQELRRQDLSWFWRYTIGQMGGYVAAAMVHWPLELLHHPHTSSVKKGL
jgi:hypothetical protein